MVYRKEKGTPLTIEEMDANFRELFDLLNQPQPVVDRYYFNLGRLNTSKESKYWHSSSVEYGFNEYNHGTTYFNDIFKFTGDIPSLFTAPYDCLITDFNIRAMGSENLEKYIFVLIKVNKTHHTNQGTLMKVGTSVPANEYGIIVQGDSEMIINKGESILLLWRNGSGISHLNQVSVDFEITEIITN